MAYLFARALRNRRPVLSLAPEYPKLDVFAFRGPGGLVVDCVAAKLE